MFRFKAEFIFFFVILPLLVTAADPLGGLCYKDLVTLKDKSIIHTWPYIVAACNVLLLTLNVTVFYQILTQIRPTVLEMRRQIFIIMDNILLSHVPNSVREVVGCMKTPAGEEEGDTETTETGTTKTSTTTTTTTTTSKTGKTGSARSE